MDNLKLIEAPHLVAQGEGPHIGQKMVLFRVHGCPIQCDACDSAYTWDGSRKALLSYTIDDFHNSIVDFKTKYKINRVMITGGEPNLYAGFFKQYFEKYEADYTLFEIETSGYGQWRDLYPWWSRIQFNFSPKIGALKGRKAIEWAALGDLPHNYCIKVVVSKDTIDADVGEAKKLQSQYGIPDDKVYLMPKGITRDEMVDQSAFVLEKAFALGYSFSPRLHILIYDNKKLV